MWDAYPSYQGSLSRQSGILLEDCKVAVDGELDPTTPAHWRETQTLAGGDGASPLHRASHGGHAEVLTLFLDHGASLSVRAARGTGAPAIHHAVSQGHLHCIRILCQRGADLSMLDALGEDRLTISEWIGEQLLGGRIRS
jgi:hypothetical protein